MLRGKNWRGRSVRDLHFPKRFCGQQVKPASFYDIDRKSDEKPIFI